MSDYFNISIESGLALGPVEPRDRPAFMENLNEKDIYRMTLQIPSPYRESDADEWIGLNAQAQKDENIFTWAIRDEANRLIGGIGFTHPFKVGEIHKAEIGYWVAKPYWGRGIMTKTVSALTQKALTEFGLSRITATVFSFNIASEKVLLKAGYVQEGYLRNYYRKEGQLIDAKLFAKFPE